MTAAGAGRQDPLPPRSTGAAAARPQRRGSVASSGDRALHFNGEESETVSVDYQGTEVYRTASAWSAAAPSAAAGGAGAAGISTDVLEGAMPSTRSKDLGGVRRNTSKESVTSVVNIDTSHDVSRLRLRPSATFIAMTPMRIGRYMSEMSDSSIVLGSASMILLPSTFHVPKSVVRRAIRSIDRTDLSTSVAAAHTATGIRMGHLLAALRRFQKAFSNDRDHDRRQSVQLVDDLGFTQPVKYVDLEMIIEWSRDWDCVYSKFCVNLTRLERLYFTLDMAENSTISSKLVSLLLFLAVVASLVVWILGTLEALRVVPEGCVPSTVNSCLPGPPMWMDTVESICIWIFTLEILMRLISVGGARRELLNQHYLINLISGNLEDEQMQTPKSCVARVSTFLVSPSFLFDFLSVVPYWVERMMDTEEQIEELSVLQVLYLARVTRVFKLGRALNADLGHFNEVYDLFRTVVMNASPAMIMTGLLIILALFFFGTCIWYCEKGEWVMRSDARYRALFVVDPGYDGAWVRKSRDGVQDELSPFGSIPSAFWWAIVTVTTVGYGDQVPYTAEGKAVGAFAMLYGTVILGLPLFVVGATFGQEYDRLMKAEKRRQETMNAHSGDAGAGRPEQPASSQGHAPDQVIEHFIDACKEFRETLEHNVSKLGIPPEVAFNWLEALRVAVTERRPSVALDHLSVRILAYLAEIEETCGRAAPNSHRGRRLLSCRKIRFSWHKVCASCCQLASAPHALLVRAFHEGLTSEFETRSGSKRSVDDAGTSNRCGAPSQISTNASYRPGPEEEEDQRHGGEVYRAATFNPRPAHTPSYGAVSEDQATAI